MKSDTTNQSSFTNTKNSLENHKMSGHKDLFFDFIKKWSRLDLRNYKPKTRITGSIIVCVISLVLFVGLMTGAILGIKNVFFPGVSSEFPQVGPEESDYFSDFTDKEKWMQYLGKISVDFNNPHYFFLGSDTPRALLKFHKQLLEKKEVTFIFKPLSQDAINIVISVGDLYEIIIGDNNYKIVSVKTRLATTGEWMPVPEESGRNLIKDIRRDSEVIVKINTEHYLDGNYSLTLDVKYITSKPLKAGHQNFHGQYIFTPPFQQYKPLDISIGLINPNHQSGIAAEFISFKMEK